MASHFSTLDITRKQHVDAATILRNAGTAIAAATSEPAIATLRWARHGEFKVLLENKAYTPYTAGTAEWKVAIEVAATAADPFTEIASTIVPGDAGTSEIPLSGELVSQAVADDFNSVIRVTATPVGAPGDIDYAAYLSPC